MRRRGLYLAGLLVLAVVAGLAWRFGAAAGLALSLAAPGAEAWVPGLREQPLREEITLATESGQLDADLHRPARPRGVLLLVHGLSRAGRRQPDVERLARLLAQHGLLVLVPQIEGLAAFRLTGREVDDIRAALRHAAALGTAMPGGSIGVAGLSFGAGPAMLAAAGVPGLRVVGSFGGYADLRHVIAYVTTGAHDFEGRHHVQRQEEYNRWKLLALLVALVADGEDRRVLDGIAGAKLANPGEVTESMEQRLGAEGRAVLALVLNRREDAVDGLIAELPAAAREALRRLSPLAAVPRIQARLLITHGTADESIPFTESLRLAAAAGGRAHLALFETFHHTGPRAFWPSLWPRARDGWRLVRVVDELLPR